LYVKFQIKKKSNLMFCTGQFQFLETEGLNTCILRVLMGSDYKKKAPGSQQLKVTTKRMLKAIASLWQGAGGMEPGVAGCRQKATNAAVYESTEARTLTKNRVREHPAPTFVNRAPRGRVLTIGRRTLFV
jgi:hypothetical protein